MTSSTLVLIDGHSLAYRAFFSFPSNLTLNQVPINAVYGFAALLMNVIDRYSPTHLAICFDRKDPTFRHVLFEQYKGHRAPAPEDFVVQMPLLKQLVDQMGIIQLDLAGYEADDLLGTLSRMADDEGMKTLILTGDRDAFQLVSPHVHVLMNRKGVSELDEFDPDAVRDKYQLEPVQLIDLKALQGDTSDNIPGVRGIGEKIATNLMMQYGSLDEIYAHLDAIKPDRVRTALTTYQDDAWMSQKLAKIDRFAPIDADPATLLFTPNWTAMVQCFQDFEFKSLVTRYQKRAVGGIVDETPILSKPTGTYTLVTTETVLETLLPTLTQGFAVDLETTSLQIHDAQIVGVAISTLPGTGIYVALNDYVESVQPQMDLFGNGTSAALFQMNPLLKRLVPVLEDPTIPKFTHNGKYEIAVLANYGIALNGIESDSMLAGFLIDPLQRVGLKEMARTYLSVEMTTYGELAGTGKSLVALVDLPAAEVAQYAGADADYTLQLTRLLTPPLSESPALGLFRDIELPLQAVLADMERTGVAIDLPYLTQLRDTYSQRLQVLQGEIHEAAGCVFNVNSTQQLAKVLFDQLQLPVIKKTKTGRSTDSDVLEELAETYPIATLLLEYRKLEKLLNTYVNALPQLVHPVTGKVHTSFNQTGAVTGRLSSTNPNLQNIPIRAPEGLAIRRAFIPSRREGLILSADYSQIELRLMAHLANDEAMLRAFRNNEDIHKSTAALIFGVPLDQVTKEQRYQAKAVNFGIIYGISPFGLSRNIGVSRADAKAIIDGYFVSFPGVKQFMDDTIEMARTDGKVLTEFGRVRPLPEMMDRNASKRQFAERTAINTRVQGTAADLIKLAMVKIYRRLNAEKFESKMMIQVHDELVFDCVPSEMDRLKELVKTEMETAWEIQIPLVADTSVGANWEEA